MQMPDDKQLQELLTEEVRGLRLELREKRTAETRRIAALEERVGELQAEVEGMRREQEFQARLDAEIAKRRSRWEKYHVPVTIAGILTFFGMMWWILQQAWRQISASMGG